MPSSKYGDRRNDQEELDYEDALDDAHDVPDYKDHEEYDLDFKDDDDNVFLDSSSSTIVLSGKKQVHFISFTSDLYLIFF